MGDLFKDIPKPLIWAGVGTIVMTGIAVGLIFLSFIILVSKPNSSKLEKYELDNHSYVVYQGYRKGGLVHDPDCFCKEK